MYVAYNAANHQMPKGAERSGAAFGSLCELALLDSLLSQMLRYQVDTICHAFIAELRFLFGYFVFFTMNQFIS